MDMDEEFGIHQVHWGLPKCLILQTEKIIVLKAPSKKMMTNLLYQAPLNNLTMN